MITPLTQEEQKLVTDNEKIIWSFINKNKLSLDTDVDYYGLCAISLCKAAQTYDNSKGSFYNYAYTIMKNNLKTTWRNISNQILTYSYEDLLRNTEAESDDIPVDILSVLSSNELSDTLNIKIFKKIFNECFFKLSKREKYIVYERAIKHKKLEEIGNNLNLSKQRIAQIFDKFKKQVLNKYRKERYDENYT